VSAGKTAEFFFTRGSFPPFFFLFVERKRHLFLVPISLSLSLSLSFRSALSSPLLTD